MVNDQERRDEAELVDLAAAASRIADAHQWVVDLCTGKRRWQMRVPVEAGDSDIVLSEALDFGEQLIGEVRQLRANLDRAADEVHAEARYQIETARRVPVNAGGRDDQWHIDRLLMVERIIREFLVAVPAAGDGS